MAAGLVAGVIGLNAALFGAGQGQSAEPDPTRTLLAVPAAVATPRWPAPTSAPGDQVLVPWRLLAPRFSRIPATTFAYVRGDLARGPGRSTVITLTAGKRDVTLDPCPDYVVRWHGAETRRGLDCGGVPFRDASGAPYLPLGVPVRFEIALELDAWELTAPGVVAASY